MLGTLTRYELKKLLGGKFFLIALCLLLAVNILLNCGIQDFVNWIEAVENGEALVVVTEESTHFWSYMAESRRITASLGARYDVFEGISQEEFAAFEAAMIEKYGEDVFSTPIPNEEMLSIPGYFGGVQSDLDYILNYSFLRDGNERIQNTQGQVIRAAQAYSQDALEDGDNYGIRRNLNIIHFFSEPRLPVTSPIRGWGDYLFNDLPMLLAGLMLLLTCSGSISGENDLQTWMLLHTAKNGRGKTLIAKYLAGIITAAGLTILFQLVTLGAVWFRCGLLGATQPAAALEQLERLPYPFSVWQYALIALVFQILAAAVLSVLLITISAICHSNILSYATGAVFLAGCFLLVFFPPKVEWLSGPLALSNPQKYFDSYYTANVCGFPVLWVAAQAALWCFLGGVCIFFAHMVYHRKRRVV